MSKTYFRLNKESFRTIYRSLNKLVDYGDIDCIEKEEVEYLLGEIRMNILHNGTTRQNYQVIDYNDPSCSQSSNRHTHYSHYGTYPIVEEVKYPYPHTLGEY